MAAKPKKNAGDVEVSLTEEFSKRAKPTGFALWIVGKTPLISHAWSQKAKIEILSKQVKATKESREPRDPDQDFVDSLYRFPDGTFGFPAMGFKDAIISSAHVKKGIAKTDVMAELWIDAEMVRLHAAHAAAMCDMPLIRLYASEPEMREDTVKIGAGMQKTAALAYRAQFTHWAVRLTGRIDTNVIPLETLKSLIDWAGDKVGVGDWRIEKRGMFGSFRLARSEEDRAWTLYAAGNGSLPVAREMESVS